MLDSSSTTYSEVELNALWETHPRCSDCGITTPYNQTAETLPEIIDFQAVGSKSNTRTYPYNVDLTSAETCAYNCCDPTGGTIVSKASCECPSDRTNADCSGVLPFECTVELVAPQLPCSDPYAPYEMKRKLYESKDCLKFSLEDTAIELSYAVSCRQVDAVPEAGDTPFEYFIERRDVNV